MASKSEYKILIIGSSMMSLYHHRLELIAKLLEQGYAVSVAAPAGGEEKDLEKLGVKFIDMPVDTRGTNVVKDLKLLRNLHKIFNSEKPDILLTFYTKTNIYGGIVAGFDGFPYIENICGLGTAIMKENVLGKLMRQLYKQALKKSSFVFFQNESNIAFINGNNIYRGVHDLLPGSGVSLERYTPQPYPKSEKTEFLFCSRILKEKGIDEYLAAAREVKKKYPDTVFHVSGPCDATYEQIIRENVEKGVIKYHGKLRDLHPLLKEIHCTVLPSYYPEGMANILLESSASARPIITTGLPGCAETVEDNVTGYVVKEKDVDSLVKAIEKFIELPWEEKEKMGIKGRHKMEREFDRRIVVDKYLDRIEKILSSKN